MSVHAPAMRLRPMTVADLPAVQLIERASFTTPWPAHAYRQELEANRLAAYLVATIGGEIVAYGPNIMQGYHNKPEQTKEVMTPDGGVRTGDRGRLDEDGFLHITGRIKEILINSYGKNIAPVPIEQAMCVSKYIEQAVVFGDHRPYLTALVVPSLIQTGNGCGSPWI